MRNVRIGHLTRVRVGTIRKFFRYVQEGIPGTLYQIHVLNVVSFFDKILTLIKPFMRAEIFKVVSFQFISIKLLFVFFCSFVQTAINAIFIQYVASHASAQL